MKFLLSHCAYITKNIIIMFVQRLILTLLLLNSFTLLFAQSATKSIFDQLYSNNDIKELTLKTDLTRLIEDRRSGEYQEAEITFTGQDGIEETHRLKVKSRGKFRRKICQFPPVKLNFSKSMLSKYGYAAEYDKLKLVTHCLDAKGAGNENVMKEYLAYKLYNELSLNSYRVQLVAITYVDSEGQLSKIKRYGFLIEDTDELSARIGGKECEDCLNVPASDLLTTVENEMAVFQYMIGNEDWSTTMVRNVKLVKLKESGKIIPVPYDFDFSGMVNTSYALPNSDYGLLDVKQRIYLGNKVTEDTLIQTLQKFIDKKETLYTLVSDYKLLNRPARQYLLSYLDSFYQEIEPAVNGRGVLSPEFGERALLDSNGRLKKVNSSKK
jgi:hypothetical protein